MRKIIKIKLRMNELLKCEKIIKYVDHNINKKRNTHNLLYQRDKLTFNSYI